MASSIPIAFIGRCIAMLSVLNLVVPLFAVMTGQAPGGSVAFTHVTVIDPQSSSARPDQTVVVRGDRIVWVGPASKAKVELGTTLIDGRGKYLLAGFTDMHVHIGSEKNLLTFVANGITTVRNMWGDSLHLALRHRVASGELLGPRIVTAGRIIDGEPPSQTAMLVLVDPAKARAEVQDQHDRGFDFIKVYNSIPKGVYDSIVAVARELRMPVAGHVPFAAGLYGAFAAHQASIEHLRGYIAELVPKTAAVQPGPSLRSRSLAWNYIDPARIPALVDSTVKALTWNCPTLVVTSEFLEQSTGDISPATRATFKFLGIKGLPPPDSIPYLRDWTKTDFAEAFRGLEGQYRMVKALFQGGAKLLAGTDSYREGFAFQGELEQLEKAGLARGAILTIATSNPAEFFHEADWGRIAVGQRADLQLIEGNPLESLQALEHRSGVMVRGRWLSKSDLDAKLDALARSYEAH